MKTSKCKYNSKKNSLRKNKKSKINIKYSRKNENIKINKMRGGTLEDDLKRLTNNDPLLTILDISSNIFGDALEIDLAEALKSNQTLTSLNISNNDIGVEGATAIAEALKSNKTLTTLNISNNDISDLGAIALAKALQANKTLTTLAIGYNNITGAGSRAIAEALKSNQTLTTLNISGNHINVFGERDLSKALELNTTLTTLIINNIKIRDYGAKAIAEALKKNSTLITLDISSNIIGDEGATAIAEALKKNSTLTTLFIFGNKISQLYLDKLYKHFDTLKLITPILESIPTPLPYNIGIEDIIQFIKDNLKKIIKQKVKTEKNNNKEKDKLIEEYINYLTLSEPYFYSLIYNNYMNGNNALLAIAKSKKFVIYLHGSIINHIFKLPTNINIVFLSPIRYMTCIYKHNLQLIGDKINAYLDNPYCYNDPDIKSIFNEAIIYLGGQYCVDLMLSRSNSNDETVTGLHLINDNSKVSSYNYDTGNLQILLSDFLLTTDFNDKAITYTIVLLSCRESKHLLPLQQDILVFYEQLLKYLNKKLFFDKKKTESEDNIKKTNTNTNTNNITKYYDDCNKRRKDILLINPVIIQLQLHRNNYLNKGRIQSRNQRTQNTIVTHTNPINFTTNKNKLDYFLELTTILNIKKNYYHDTNIFTNSFLLGDKDKFDRIKLIFINNYELMFEFIVYIDLNYNIINFDYFFTDKLLQNIDVTKINYRISLKAFKFIKDNLDISKLTTLDISYNYIDFAGAGAKALAEALTTLTTLTTLNISNNYIGDAGATVIAEALKSNTNTALTILNISGNDIGGAGATVIAEALKSNETLTILNISGNDIGVEGATAIAETLKTNKKLTTLDIRINNIGGAGATVIAEALKSNETLTILNISGNDIGVVGAIAITETLKTNTTALTILDIRSNKIGDAGVNALAEALKTNNTLTSLNISNNDIGDEGATALKEALQQNLRLTALYTSGNNIGVAATEALKKALKTN